LARILGEFVDTHGLGVVLTEAGFLLSRDPDTVRGPDVAFVRADRFDAAEAGRAYFRGAPDLAVEILSPSNRPGDIHARVADYLAAGARLVWIIDPVREIVDVYRSLLMRRRLPAHGVLDGEDVLPGLAVTIAEILKH
jgi:Uma2 family endonuclease